MGINEAFAIAIGCVISSESDKDTKKEVIKKLVATESNVTGINKVKQ